MRKQILISITLLLSFFININAQESEQKAAEIIEKAKHAILKEAGNIRNIYSEFEGNHNVPKQTNKFVGIIESYTFTSKSKLWIEFPNKVRFKELTDFRNFKNQSLVDKSFDGSNLSDRRAGKFDSDTGFREEVSMPNPNGEIQKKIEKQSLPKFKYEIFSTSFQLLLRFSDNLKFSFAGAAKAGEQKADVIETTLADMFKIRLFFDQNTHLLLMMTSEYYDEVQEKKFEQRFFYSDYREENGLLCAHKIIKQENGEVVEERVIKIIKLNENIKPDFFDIKK